MKTGNLLKGRKRARTFLLVFTMLFLVSALASGPARIKLLAIGAECSIDGSQMLVHSASAPDLAAPLGFVGVAPMKISLSAGPDFVSGSSYRGPPSLSL